MEQGERGGPRKRLDAALGTMELDPSIVSRGGWPVVGYQQHATAERWQEASGDGLVEWFFLHLLCIFPHLQLGRHNIDMKMITLSSSTNLFVLTLLYMSSCTQLVSW